jgi:hypothetical protein
MIGPLLGRGANAEVREVTNLENKDLKAMKIYNLNAMEDD